MHALFNALSFGGAVLVLRSSSVSFDTQLPAALSSCISEDDFRDCVDRVNSAAAPYRAGIRDGRRLLFALPIMAILAVVVIPGESRGATAGERRVTDRLIRHACSLDSCHDDRLAQQLDAVSSPRS